MRMLNKYLTKYADMLFWVLIGCLLGICFCAGMALATL